MRSHGRSVWRGVSIPGALLVVAIIPLLAGAARLYWLGNGTKNSPQDARFYASPLPVILHIVSANMFCVLGASQFWKEFRIRKPRTHRAVGFLAAICGSVAAITGLWMNQFYPYAHNDGIVLYGLRLFFGTAMMFALLTGAISATRGRFAKHGAWMTRGYAIGLGAGTQALTQLPIILTVGEPTKVYRALLMGAGWIINLVIAEHMIERAKIVRAPT